MPATSSGSRLSSKLKNWVRSGRREVRVLQLALHDRRTPWYAKAWLALVVAYALSPIDLIPDFVPVLGYLDDVVLVSVGIWVAFRLIPECVVSECRRQADIEIEKGRFTGWAGFVLVICLWALVLGLAVWLVLSWLGQTAP